MKRLGGIFSGFLTEQNRYNLDRENDKSILRSSTMNKDKLRSVANDEDATIIRPKPIKKARLLIELNGNVIGKYELDQRKPLVTLGRIEINDVVVPSRTVSRMHARLRYSGNMWLIEDTESLNGLLYQGERLDQIPLTNGDRVYLAPKAVVQYISEQ